ncbi:tetratricopeptide repeat protein [Marinigracilibium pacificum]|uniref:Tetratricopeptide repeat protein n=1 Tax=Marinigracilibium pacificum TaxID=2729599 RepID=A0A848IVQ1_9BACT|nr:DUF2225 domain-containing protein [Marinigracilibium pacificum]NMM48563.1 tetratricopeptide repeat protein [Marinigracilibium pacificum]
MRLSFWGACILFSMHSLFCFTAKKDSLKLILESEGLSIEDRASTLIAYGDLLNDSDPTEAVDIHLKAIDMAKKSGSDIYLVRALRGLGISYTNIGLYDDGLNFVIRSLEKAKQINYYDGIIKAFNNIGVIYMYLDQYEDAKTNFDKLSSFIQKDDVDNWRNYYMNLGILYWKKGDFQNSIDSYQRALKSSMKLGDLRECGIIYHNMGTLYRDKKQFHTALEYYNKALSIYKNLNNPAQIPAILISSGKVYHLLGDLGEAERLYLEGLDLASEYELIKVNETGFKFIYELYKDLDQPQKALNYYEKYSAIKEELIKNNSETKIAFFKDNYASIRQNYENDLLRKESELNQSIIRNQEIIIIATVLCLLALIIISLILIKFNRERKIKNEELRRSNREIIKQKEQLDQQSKDLIEAHSEILRMNENLEREILIRTEKVKSQNKTILKYSFRNAHKIRGPLARIIGLINLLNEEKDRGGDDEIIIHMLTKEVFDLEKEIKSIKNLLEKEEIVD